VVLFIIIFIFTSRGTPRELGITDVEAINRNKLKADSSSCWSCYTDKLFNVCVPAGWYLTSPLPT
jgi:hypothetical protein